MENVEQRRFTGRQVTAMVIAVCLAIVLAPVGVFAASQAHVSIVDANHPSRATTVTKSGRLEVSGAVTGTVNARPILPGKPFESSVTQYTGDSAAVTLPKGHLVVIQNISAEIGATQEGGDSGGLIVTYKYKGKSKQESVPAPTVGIYYFFAASATTIYADPGSTVNVTAFTALAANSNILTNFTIDGYST